VTWFNPARKDTEIETDMVPRYHFDVYQAVGTSLSSSIRERYFWVARQTISSPACELSY
jgi:hypothetical protein